jgi:predicted 2-oxoglutarate/Fe(II)-dependent dioxygenase YbiX
MKYTLITFQLLLDNFEIKRLKLDKGSIVFFPSNFMYPHMIEPITKGTRYSIVAWLQ